MGLPKKKKSTTRRDKRRTHDHLTPVNVISCPKCGSALLPHRACRNCGSYAGKTRLVVGP